MRIVYGVILALFATLIGFWPSFFSNPAQNDTLHIVHGALATGWMLMLALQAGLMARGHVRAHHLIGRLSPLLFIPLVVTAVIMVHAMLTASVAHGMPADLALILAYADVTSLTLFVLYYILAIVFAFRRQIDLHYRLLLSTLAFALVPALGRIHWPWSHGLPDGLMTADLMVEALLVAGLIYDLVRYKKVFPPYAVTLVAMIVIHASEFSAPHIQLYMVLARLLGYAG